MEMGEIDAIAARYADTVYRKDEAGFLSLYHPEAVIFDAWERWSYQGVESWADMVRIWFDSLGDEQVRVTFRPIRVVVQSDAAMWCATARYAGVSAAGVEVRSLENRLSWWLERGANGWLIIHEHSSAPADFSTLKVSLHENEPKS